MGHLASLLFVVFSFRGGCGSPGVWGRVDLLALACPAHGLAMANLVKSLGGIFRSLGRAIDNVGISLQGANAYVEQREYRLVWL